MHTVKNLAFVVCRAKGRLRLAVLLGSGLVRSFGVLFFSHGSGAPAGASVCCRLEVAVGASLSRDEYPSAEHCR